MRIIYFTLVFSILLSSCHSNDNADSNGAAATVTDSVVVTPDSVSSRSHQSDFVTSSAAPVGDQVKKIDSVYTSVEESAEFPGGLDKKMAFLAKNLRYPAEARANNVQGRVVVQFIVEKDGSLTDVHVVRGLGSGTDQETIRVFRASPRWKPGIEKGRPVRQLYTMPVNFTLQDQ